MLKNIHKIFQKEKTFKEAAEQFLIEYKVIEDERHPTYVKCQHRRVKQRLIPFFQDIPLSEINASIIQSYRAFRKKSNKPPSKSTLHQEIVTLRQVLKTAIRQGWLGHLPDFSNPFRKVEKISHRGWFNPDEYKKLCDAIQHKIDNPFQGRYVQTYEHLLDMVVFMVNTGLRPDELKRIKKQDIKIVSDISTGKEILIINVRGKRGVGHCKSMPEAVGVYNRLIYRDKPKEDELLFKTTHPQSFNRILMREHLKFDREGNSRSSYSLRHTYICFRLLAGADIYQVAKNCRTSVEMIEKFYAAHLQNNIDASAINK